ncbi:MAG: VWA domain-containing protein [Gammaproteobacteria bacterium]|nr:VWA domain-containing protein [Gammaproteobacteria bacterium]
MNEFITNFHLIRPWCLLLLLPSLIFLSLLHNASKQRGQWHKLIPAHLATLLIDNNTDKHTQLPLYTLALLLVVSVIALAGPTWQKLPQPLFKVNSAQVIVMDMSLSMYATDIKPNRLTRARFKVTDLINQLTEGETGLIAYAGDAFVISPMTEDINNLLNLLPALSPEIMPEYGSEPATGIDAALTLFKQTQKESGDIYLITDGISASDQRQITKLLANTDFSLHILAVGGTDSAPIKLPNGELLKDSNGNIVLPKLTLAPLTTLARQFNGRFAKIALDNSDIIHLAKTDHDFYDTNISQNKLGDAWDESGPWLLLFMLPIAALAFRRGILTSLAVLSLALSPMIITKPAMAMSESEPETNAETQPKTKSDAAANVASSGWDSLWQTKDQQGIKAFNQGQFEQAANTFEDSNWQGASLYRAKDYQGALDAFSAQQTPDALYNQGNALMKLQQYDEAISRYQQVLSADENHPAAQGNLQLAEKLKQQQKKEQQQGDDSSQQEGDQENKEQDQEQQKDQQSDDSQQSSDQQQDSEQSDSQSQQSDQNDPSQQNQEQEQEQQDQGEQSEDENEQQTAPPEQAEEAEKKVQGKKQQSLFDDKNLTKEQQRHLEQLLKKVADDPSLLLRNKMALEARKRRSGRIIKKDRVNW